MDEELNDLKKRMAALPIVIIETSPVTFIYKDEESSLYMRMYTNDQKMIDKYCKNK